MPHAEGADELIASGTRPASDLPRPRSGSTSTTSVGDPAAGEVFVIAGLGPSCDWYRNLQANPAIEVVVGRRRFEPAHRLLGGWCFSHVGDPSSGRSLG
ncbi:MAG: nitroreductase family deazaflavin-dependent oxidoreductase [Actinomycetota bacterium]|nr:nitroreductase family deazaflavin-dependent oxidoreductase [Actinomycetota bacterium]